MIFGEIFRLTKSLQLLKDMVLKQAGAWFSIAGLNRDEQRGYLDPPVVPLNIDYFAPYSTSILSMFGALSLVGGFKHLLFSHMLGIIVRTD